MTSASAVLRHALLATLSLLLACSSASDEPATITITPAANSAKAAKGSFVGTIRLLEKRPHDNPDYVIITLDGPRLRREVRPGGFADSTDRYGIIADLRTDSVIYFVQDAERNVHCRLARAEYLERVAANDAVLPSLYHRPYSSVFAPLPTAIGSLRQEVKLGVKLGKVPDCHTVLFLLADQTRCTATYSAQVRVPAPVLAYIEHNAPSAIPTLALAVDYTTPRPTGKYELLNELEERAQQTRFPHTRLSSLDQTRPPAGIFAPPPGSQYAGSADDLEESIAPRGSSHSFSDD